MRVLPSLLAGLCLATLVRAATPMSLDELLKRNLEARGGAARLAALKSVRLRGEATFRGGFKLAFTRLVARPGRVRNEMSLQGLSAIQAWDGREGWSVMPFGGRKEPERMSADDAKELVLLADLDGPLVHWKEKGSRLAYLGTEDVDGTAAHKVQVVHKDGTEQTVYLDPDHFLEIRVTTRMTVRGSLQESEVDLGEYAQVGGVWMPMALDAGSPGGPRFQFLKFTKAEADVPFTEADFAFPAGPSK